MSAGFDGTKPARISLVRNPTFSSPPSWEYVNEGQSALEFAPGAVGLTVSGGELVETLSSAKDGSVKSDLDELIRLVSGDVLALVARASSGTTDVSASMTLVED